MEIPHPPRGDIREPPFNIRLQRRQFPHLLRPHREPPLGGVAIQDPAKNAASPRTIGGSNAENGSISVL